MKAFLFFIVNLFVLLAWARPQIEVRAQNEVLASKDITLGDLADFKGFSDELEKRWRPIVVVGEWQGQTTEIPRQQLVQLLKEEMSTDMQMKLLNPSLLIPDVIKIQKRQVAMDEKSIGAVLRESLAKLCVECQIEVLSVKLPKFVGQIENLELNLANLEIKASQTVPVQFSIKNKQMDAFVTVQARFKKHSIVAKRPLRQGDRIQRGDVESALIDISNIANSTAVEQEIVGRLLSHSVASGQAILKGDVIREPAIKKGQAIKITTGSTLFEVSTSGQAEENGFIGDVIKIKASENNKLLSGKVIEEGKVVLQ